MVESLINLRAALLMKQESIPKEAALALAKLELLLEFKNKNASNV